MVATSTAPQTEQLDEVSREIMQVYRAELEPVCRKLKRLWRRHRKNSLQGYYEIGEAAKPAIGHLKQQLGSGYGGHVIDFVAEAAGIDARTLRNCVVLVEVFSATDYHELISRPEITWSHILQLLSAPNTDREELLASVIEQRWSPDELARQLRQRYGNRRAGSGRRPAVPQSAKHGLVRLLAISQKFSNALEGAIFGSAFDLPAALSNIPPDDVNPDIREQAEYAAGLLQGISEQTASDAARLRHTAKHLGEILDHRNDAREG